MKVGIGTEAYYAGIGEVYFVKVTRPVHGGRGIVKGWNVMSISGPGSLILDPVSKYDLYPTEDEATKAAFVKKLKHKG